MYDTCVHYSLSLLSLFLDSADVSIFIFTRNVFREIRVSQDKFTYKITTKLAWYCA